MVDTKQIFIRFAEDEMYSQGVIDIRKLLSKFVTNKKISLSDLTFLGIVANYYMQAAVVNMNKAIDPFFDSESESPLLDSCAEFRQVCELLEDPCSIEFIKGSR